MAEATTATTTANKPNNKGRRTLRAEGRKKRKVKLQADKAFAKTFFEAKSTRSTAKKAAFRKKKKGKK